MTLLGNVWSGFLIPAIDILLIAFVFYRLLLLIKGTHAVQVIMGLAVLMLTTLIARDFLHLRATTWLLENFWGNGRCLFIFFPFLFAR